MAVDCTWVPRSTPSTQEPRHVKELQVRRRSSTRGGHAGELRVIGAECECDGRSAQVDRGEGRLHASGGALLRQIGEPRPTQPLSRARDERAVAVGRDEQRSLRWQLEVALATADEMMLGIAVVVQRLPAHEPHEVAFHGLSHVAADDAVGAEVRRTMRGARLVQVL